METNPILIMAINMTIVFTVLIVLGVLMEIIHMVDPTKKKPAKPEPVAAPAPVQAAAPTPVVDNSEEIVAAIMGAIVAMGYSSDQIASIRLSSQSQGWKLDGRLSGRN